MKRSTLVALLVTAAVMGGLLILFPAEWVGLLLALMALVTAQVILLRRHIKILPYPPDAIPQPAAPVAGSPVAAAGAPAEPAPAPAGEGLPTAEVFSRFRAHLETMERGASSGPAGRSPPGAAPPVTAEVAAADRVELSAVARARSAKPASVTHETPKAAATPPEPPAKDEEEGPDLFADLRPALAVGRAGAAPGKAGAQRGTALAKGAGKRGAAPSAPAPDEVGQALARAHEPEQVREEGAALIRIAQDALEEDNLPRAKAVLEQYESMVADAPTLATWEAARAQLRLAAREGRGEAIAPAFQAMLDRGHALAEEGLEGAIDALLDGFPEERKAPVKVALLLKTLAPFRQSGDRAAMDRLYERIEAAQEAAGDERKLIQYYKNHLAIKEAQGDLAGQLSLIDKIGNRYYQLGDTAPAKEFYELAMKLRAEPEQARTDAGNAPAPPAAPPAKASAGEEAAPNPPTEGEAGRR